MVFCSRYEVWAKTSLLANRVMLSSWRTFGEAVKAADDLAETVWASIDYIDLTATGRTEKFWVRKNSGEWVRL